MQLMHLFLSAGEPSGDLHGASVIREFRRHFPSANIVGFGGERMAAEGARLLYPLTDLAVMWFGRALANLPTFFKLGRQAEVYFRSHRPDAVLLIDYPGFNFALAKRAHRHNIPVFYFVPPQLWAWAGWRVHKMQRWVDTVLTALPFEDEWYRQRGVQTHYIGHPYFDDLAQQRLDESFLAAQQQRGGTIITLLPGSRNQEVLANAPLMLAVAERIHAAEPSCRFAVAAFNTPQASMIRQLLTGAGLPIEVHVGRTPELIELAHCCLAVSGSVSLELLYRLKPSVIIYKVAPAGLFLARQLKTCQYICLVNLLANAEIYPEFLTSGEPSEAITQRIVSWIRDPAERQAVVDQLQTIRTRVAVPGACERAAQYILMRLKDREATADRSRLQAG
jgi:lipid-A-disaccharide synthase